MASHCIPLSMKKDDKTKKKCDRTLEKLNEIYVIFDFYMNRPNMTNKDFVFKEKNVYKTKAILSQAYSRTKDSKRDFALVELRHAHPDELKLDTSPELKL